MTIRKDPHERVSYSARQTENPTGVIPPHNRALRTNRHIYDLRCTRAVLLSIDSYWLCANISITAVIEKFPQLKNTGSAQSGAVQQNVCIGGHLCAAPGPLPDYPHDCCGCCPERRFCPASHQRNIRILRSESLTMNTFRILHRPYC